MSQDQPFIWKSTLGGPVSWVGQSLGISKVGQSVSQVEGVSVMAPTCRICGGVRFGKGTIASAHLDARHFSFSLYTTGAF